MVVKLGLLALPSPSSPSLTGLLGNDGLWCNCAKASARSSARKSLFGASSNFISHPAGGDGGGEMKNSLPASGNGRCSSLGSMGVARPK